MAIGHTGLTAVLSILESAINGALEFDPGTQEALRQLQDKVLELECTQPRLSLFICARHAKICLASAKSVEAEATLSGKLPHLIALLSKAQHSLADSGVTSSGNLQVISAYQNLLSQLDIDWEAMLVKVSGDVAGHQFASFARTLQSWAKSSHIDLPEHFSQYLQNEIKIIPSKAEVASFSQQVDALRSATDRLEAQLNALNASRMEGAE